MHNKETKNWNNFFLGLLVVILPWLSLPEKLQAGIISFLALLIMLFSLANIRGRSRFVSEESAPAASISKSNEPEALQS